MKEQCKKIERCGFCGSYFRGIEYLSKMELEMTDSKVLDNAPLGYCPNAYYEDDTRRVTKDMAVDAGDLSLEGQLIN